MKKIIIYSLSALGDVGIEKFDFMEDVGVESVYLSRILKNSNTHKQLNNIETKSKWRGN